MKLVQDFAKYSEKDINKIIENSPGLPYRDEFGITVGTIISAKRVSDTRLVEFDVKIDA